jgi:hypothetical protein
MIPDDTGKEKFKHQHLMNNPIIQKVSIAAFLMLLQLSACESDETTVKYQVTTIAGTGAEGFTNGDALSADFRNPTDITFDASGNLHVVDMRNYVIRKISPDGLVSTFAGSSVGSADGAGEEAQFMFLSQITSNAKGELFVSDGTRIRKISNDGVVTTFVNPFEEISPGVSVPGFTGDMTTDADGNLYVIYHHYLTSRILHITPDGVLSTYHEHDAILKGIAIDDNGNIFVGEQRFLENRIIKITPLKKVRVIADIPMLSNIVLDKSTSQIFFSAFYTDFETYYDGIYKLDTNGRVSQIAGGKLGFSDGIGKKAQFHSPAGITIDSDGNIYVADSGNNRIRKITAIR